MRKRVSAGEVAQVLEMRAGGATLKEIGEAVGISGPTAWEICRRAGVKGQVMVRWRPEWTEVARRMRARGATLRDIGDALGVTATTVLNHLGRRGPGVVDGPVVDRGFDFGG